MNRLLRHPRGLASLAFLLLLAVVAVTAPWIMPYSPNEPDFANLTTPPSAEHWLGTDDLGRDTFSRILFATGPSLYASVLAVTIGVALGLPVGLLAGYAGGVVDAVISRGLDALLTFPMIILAIGVTSVLGANLTDSMLAIGVSFSPQFARLIRASTLVVRQELYVDAARQLGAGPVRLLLRHVLPNAVQSVVVQAGLLLSVALLAESSLSFLGLGVQPPLTSWGAMIARAYGYLEVNPIQIYPPGIAILLTAMAFNGAGELVRLLLDPRR